MERRAPGELEQLLNRLPHAVLFRFQDEARKAFTRTKNPQFFSGNDWIDLDDLKAWLGQQEDLKHFLNEPTILDSYVIVLLAVCAQIDTGPLVGSFQTILLASFNHSPTTTVDVEDRPAPLSNNTLSPLSESIHLPAPELDTALPRQSPPQPPSSPRRSSRKRKISITDEDAPVKKAKISASDGPSKSTKPVTSRRVIPNLHYMSESYALCSSKRKSKPWGVRHTDDQFYTSFEFLAKFPEEYREMYGDAEPA
ncbi:hypothetical protein B0H10DRAFT_2196234 [Mycena sp. CBHHK59/15]|nr:hypothetical protein B0H10DRAFT_2196234 [Mycena sp. CBHHK59/15]